MINDISIKLPHKSFKECTNKHKKDLAQGICDAISKIAKEDINYFMDYLRENTEFGKSYMAAKGLKDKIDKVFKKSVVYIQTHH